MRPRSTILTDDDKLNFYPLHLEMSEPIDDRLEDDALLADIEALRESLPQVCVQHQEVALLDAALKEGAGPVVVRGQNEFVQEGNPYVSRVGRTRTSFGHLQSLVISY